MAYVALSKKDSMNVDCCYEKMVEVGSWNSDLAEPETHLCGWEIEAGGPKGHRYPVGLGFLSDSRCVVVDVYNNMSLYKSGYEKLNVTFNTLAHSEGGVW